MTMNSDLLLHRLKKVYIVSKISRETTSALALILKNEFIEMDTVKVEYDRYLKLFSPVTSVQFCSSRTQSESN